MVNGVLTQVEKIQFTNGPVVLGYGPGMTVPPRTLVCNSATDITVTLPLTTVTLPLLGQGTGTKSITPGIGPGYLLTVLNISSTGTVTIEAATGDVLVDIPVLDSQYTSVDVCSSDTNSTWYCVSQGTGGGGGTPAGASGQIQFNNAGAFGASANFSRDLVTGGLTVNAVSGDAFEFSNVSADSNSYSLTGQIFAHADGDAPVALTAVLQLAGFAVDGGTGLQIPTPPGPGSLVNGKALEIQDWANNWAIKTGLGTNYFGDVVIVHRNTAPADGELAAGDLAFWLDDTNGAAKAMFKAKSANGTVVTGNVALA